MIKIETLALTEGVPTKSDIAASASELATNIYEGNMTSSDILRTLAYASAVIEVCEQYKKILSAAAACALNDFSGEMNGNTLHAYGVTFTKKAGKPEYDYEGEDYESLCQREKDAKAALKVVTDEKKALEKLLVAQGKAIVMYTNDETVSVTINQN